MRTPNSSVVGCPRNCNKSLPRRRQSIAACATIPSPLKVPVSRRGMCVTNTVSATLFNPKAPGGPVLIAADNLECARIPAPDRNDPVFESAQISPGQAQRRPGFKTCPQASNLPLFPADKRPFLGKNRGDQLLHEKPCFSARGLRSCCVRRHFRIACAFERGPQHHVQAQLHPR